MDCLFREIQEEIFSDKQPLLSYKLSTQANTSLLLTGRRETCSRRGFRTGTETRSSSNRFFFSSDTIFTCSAASKVNTLAGHSSAHRHDTHSSVPAANVLDSCKNDTASLFCYYTIQKKSDVFNSGQNLSPVEQVRLLLDCKGMIYILCIHIVSFQLVGILQHRAFNLSSRSLYAGSVINEVCVVGGMRMSDVS